MKKSKFTEEQIAFALREVETGTRVSEVCRKMGIAEATIYNWKEKFEQKSFKKPNMKQQLKMLAKL